MDMRNQYPESMILLEDYKSFSIYYCGTSNGNCILYKVPTWQARLVYEWDDIGKFLSTPCINYNLRQNGEMIVHNVNQSDFLNDQIVNDLIDYVYQSDSNEKSSSMMELIICYGHKLNDNHIDKILSYDKSETISSMILNRTLSLKTMMKLHLPEKILKREILKTFNLSEEYYSNIRKKYIENNKICDNI